ncbi:hypothetical protein SKAU_G00040730 [Synaphobranchus kaupii]|uniref:Nuclear protein MDM1 n=1 Tax=Synaphobranchus kaupii TaxID=118154 RepID=A0A9Q1G0Z5_SYNKA|nr:hypothetical protein SKAU_G00040730 [Synaphobranchus kaupii]
MAVKFKGISEYQSKFKGRSARSRSVSPQLKMRQAGLRSDQLGVSKEPQFLSKRRVVFHRPQVSQSFQWEGPEESPRERQTPRPSTTPAAAPPVEGPGNAERPATPQAPRGPRVRALCAKSKPVAPAPPPAQAPPPSAEPRRSVTVEEAEPVLNGVQHVLKRKAGLKLAGRTNRLQSSEYQRQFQRKTPTASSPLLAAEQMVYSSCPVIPPFKVNPLVQESEYRRSFKGSPPPRAPPLRRDLEEREGAQFRLEQVSPERAVKRKKKKKKKQQQLSRKPGLQNGPSQCGLQSQQQEVRSQSPQQPHPSHGGYRKVKSEYNSHFRSPLHYRLKDGLWVKSSTVGEEARELREKAEGYRRRAWGTHFSRDHLNQILSEKNRLWEASTGSFTERSSTSTTIQALDLASNESVRGIPSVRGSLPSSPSGSGRSSVASSEEERLQNAPTLPVRRKLVWGEAGQGAGPEQKDRDDRDKLGEEPHGRKRQEEEEEEEEDMSDKATTSEDQHPSPASDSHSSLQWGRLATPKMKTITTIQRTHHDLTTPTTGGAILVSPPKLKESAQGSSMRRSEPALGKPYSPYKSLSRASPERVSSKVEESGLPHSSPAAGLTTADPIPLREDPWPAHPSPDHPPAPRPARTSHGHGPVTPPLPVSVLANRIHGKLRDPEFQHNGNLGLARHDMAVFPSTDFSDDDDRMSQISARSAASCSMASQVLERAQKRRKNFWGKS